MKKANDTFGKMMENINSELIKITETTKQSKVGISTLKRDLLEMEKDYLKKATFRLTKNKLDIL
tara:strand:- start:1029 stop:1220 length:192 start_codon:yes stop_codon:yes gene_type:complete